VRFAVQRVAADVNSADASSLELHAAVRTVRERLDPRVPALVHPVWAAELPWVVQGTTTRGPDPTPFDLGLFSEGSPRDTVRAHWDRLLAATEMRRALHARQVHGAEVRLHDPRGAEDRGHGARADEPWSGLVLADECDGHVTSEPGVLLAVSTADCVPIFVADPAGRTVAVLHAGWRGVAAGMLERGLDAVAPVGRRGQLRVHLGPAICGSCYEVGPEVFEAVGLGRPERPQPIDLRRVLADRAIAHAASPDHVTVSEHCTRCTGSGLFSHRGGDRGRQVGYIGIRG
jgi:YfiH family protein